jgi:hypothetical protein
MARDNTHLPRAAPPSHGHAHCTQSAAPRHSLRQLAGGLAAALTMAAWTAAHGAPPDRPPAGTDVDETRTVAQRTRAPTDCLQVVLQGVAVLLDRSALILQANAKPAQWKTEAERMALIKGRRAAALLQAASPGKAGDQGCHQVTQSLDGEDQFVVLAHLERGAAAVLPAGAAQPVPAVALRYRGSRCGPTCGRGHIMVSVPGQQRPFLVADWWAS